MGGGLCLRSGEGLSRAPLICFHLCEVAQGTATPSLGLLLTLHFQRAHPLSPWLGGISLGVFPIISVLEAVLEPGTELQYN